MIEREQKEPVLYVGVLEEDTERTIARVALRGVNKRVINHLSTTTYEVLLGEGVMDLDGQLHELKEGTVITVPAGTPYRDEGDMMMLATSVPPFDPEYVEVINDENTGLIESIDSIENDWENRIRTETLCEAARNMGGLLTYELTAGDKVSVVLSAFDGSSEPRKVTAIAGKDVKHSGQLEVIEDSVADGAWTGKIINLGSYTNNLGMGGVQAICPGLLRGYLIEGSMVAIDTAGQHFIRDGNETAYMPLLYSELSVNDIVVYTPES